MGFEEPKREGDHIDRSSGSSMAEAAASEQEGSEHEATPTNRPRNSSVVMRIAALEGTVFADGEEEKEEVAVASGISGESQGIPACVEQVVDAPQSWDRSKASVEAAPNHAEPRNSSIELQMKTLESTVLSPEDAILFAKQREKAAASAMTSGQYSQTSAPQQESPRPVQPGAVPIPGINSTIHTADEEASSTEIDADQQDGHANINQSDALIQAYTVSEAFDEAREGIKADLKAEVEEEVRQQMMEDALEADVITDETSNAKRKRRLVAGAFILALILATVLLTAFLVKSNHEDSGNDNQATTEQQNYEPTAPVARNSTLDIIRRRGFVKCGVLNDRLGFAAPKGLTGELEGINVDQCKAISMAIFGNPNQITLENIQPFTRFTTLGSGEVDVLTDTVTHNMERDVFWHQTETGFTFSTPYYYTGMAFWGPPEYLECAEALDAETGICKNLTVCVSAFGSHEFVLRSLLPPEAIVAVSTFDQLAVKLRDGTCVAGAGDAIFTSSNEYVGDLAGTKVFSKEPLTLVTREDDQDFSSLVDLIVNAFFLAEAHNISHDNPSKLEALVGSNLAPMLIPIITEFGNYADLYERHLKQLRPREGLNRLYSKSDNSGLLYNLPFGVLSQIGPNPDSNGAIAAIQARGFLSCGVVDRGGGMLEAFDIQFCAAVSAALFAGSTDNLELITVSRDASYQTLLEDRVDLLAGVRLSPVHAFKEPSTGSGFSMSKPYYYDIVAMEAFGFATNARDPKWADLVDWVIMATIYAEESGIGQTTADEMPLLSLFGQSMTPFFRSVIGAVGSYNEIYNQTLEATIPRVGSGNELNHELLGPQLFAIPFQ